MPKQTRKTRSSRFGEILKNARLKSGLTNNQFAVMLKMSYATIWRYENGERTPTLETADRILRKLGRTMTIGKELKHDRSREKYYS